jgi:hypothetical protein
MDIEPGDFHFAGRRGAQRTREQRREKRSSEGTASDHSKII